MSMRRLVVAVAVVALGVAAYFLFLRKRSAEAPAPARATATAPVVPAASKPPAADPAEGRPPEARVAADDDPAGALRLEGQVIDDEERPVGGALVQLTSRPRRTVKTETDGSFAFDKLVGRSYTVDARKGDGFGGPVTVRLSDKTEPVILRMKEASSVEVTVVALETRKPIAGAAVGLDDEPETSTTTDAQGKARLRGVADGWQTVEASAPGYAREVSFFEISGKRGTVHKHTIELKRGAAVSGTVVDVAGKPVAGAKVTPLDTSSMWAGAFEGDGVASDGKGRFTIAALPAGTFRFEARHAQHAPGTSAAVTLDGQTPRTDVVVKLAAPARVAGRVVTKGGQPAGGASVRIAAKDAGARWELTRQAYTDDKGEFDIGGLPRATMEIAASTEKAASAIVEVDLATTPEQRNLTITLDIEGVIAGVVVNAQGEPVADAQVIAAPELSARRQAISTWRLRGFAQDTTDVGGRFELGGLADGNYRLRASRGESQRGAWLREAVTAKPGDTNVRLVLQSDGRVKGRVLYEDGSAPAAYSVSTGFGEGTPFSDPGGAFAVDAPAGRATIIVSGPEFVRKMQPAVEVKPDAEVDVGTITVERGRSISGRVLRADGAPVAGARVVCGPQLIGSGSELGGSGLFGGGGIKNTTTGDDGAFTLSGVGARSLVIAAEHPTEGRSNTVRLPAAAQSVTLDLMLRPLAPLEGRVTSNGKALAQAIVLAAPQQASRGSFMVRSAEDGAYRFDKLAPDTYIVTAMQAGMMAGSMFSRTVTVTEQGGHLDIELPTAGVTVTITVVPPEGVKVNAAQVFLMSGKISVTNAGQLMDRFAEAGEGAAHMSFVLKGEPARLENVVAGAYSACGIPIPGDINSAADMMRIRDKVDQLLAACIPAQIADSPATQSVAIPVPEPPNL